MLGKSATLITIKTNYQTSFQISCCSTVSQQIISLCPPHAVSITNIDRLFLQGHTSIDGFNSAELTVQTKGTNELLIIVLSS